MPDQPTTPAPDASGSLSWIAPTEIGRAKQLLGTHPHLVAEQLELRWFLNPEVLAHATAQVKAVGAKSSTAVLRPVQTEAMKTVVKAMSKPLTELRALIKKKYKEQYEGYYPQFGLVKSGPNWILPTDHDVLVDNLRDLLLPALLTHGFDKDPDAGTAVWQPLLDRLDTAHTAAVKTDTARATARATTTPQDEKTEKALRAIYHLVQAQYPDTWEAILRGWGWLKASL